MRSMFGSWLDSGRNYGFLILSLNSFDIRFGTRNPVYVSILYLVPTPIGHLADITLRSLEVLRAVDRIVCEDTRVSSKLLRHYEIQKPLQSIHQHNEHRAVPKLIESILAGQSVAWITDAGMPGISDPGFLAVRAARQAGVPVVPLPGADAATTALVASGLPCDRYLFEGFLPPKKGRQTRIQDLANREITTIFYESPHRILKLLDEIETHLGPDRLLFIAREMTKKFEEFDRGPAGELSASWKERPSIKGELVVIVAGSTYKEEPDEEPSSNALPPTHRPS